MRLDRPESQEKAKSYRGMLTFLSSLSKVIMKLPLKSISCSFRNIMMVNLVLALSEILNLISSLPKF